MSTLTTACLSPPESVQGMTCLDKSLFNKTICVPFVEIEEQLMESAVKCLKPYLLKLKDFNPVVNEEKKRIVILNPELIASVSDLIGDDTECRHVLRDLCHIRDIGWRDMDLKYENYSHKQVLDAVLPKDSDSVSSFSTIGHILHLNLRPHTFPYKRLIGQVLLDKIKSCELVVNKVNSIANEFRNFEMEVLAQRSPSVTTTVKIKESFCEFEFDFARVYWNPRLGTEHDRIQLKLNKGVDVLYDVFAGVGPFAIPAAKRRKCHVLANDLNPECYKWLQHNSRLNGVDDRLSVYNLDGRQFIQTVIRDHLIHAINTFDGIERTRQYHIVTNLPSLAIQFLDAFKGLLHSIDSSRDYQIDPIIHCYCFVKDEPNNGPKIVKRMAEEVLDHELDSILEIVNIRKVAPNKDMFRISFQMPRQLLYKQPCSNHKKQKVE